MGCGLLKWEVLARRSSELALASPLPTLTLIECDWSSTVKQCAAVSTKYSDTTAPMQFSCPFEGRWEQWQGGSSAFTDATL